MDRIGVPFDGGGQGSGGARFALFAHEFLGEIMGEVLNPSQALHQHTLWGPWHAQRLDGDERFCLSARDLGVCEQREVPSRYCLAPIGW